MSWLWVTRRTHDELLHITERLQEDLRVSHERLAEAQRHDAALLKAFFEQRAAAAPTSPVMPPVALPAPVRNEIEEAIELAARDNKILARHLGREALRAKLEGEDERTIINSILHWKPDAWGDEAPRVP